MTCAQLYVGNVRCWGYYSSTLTASAVDGVESDDVALAVGSGHACVLQTDDTIRCWGRNSYGQLGNGDFVDQPVPTAVVGF